jgi:hypothetical protein
MHKIPSKPELPIHFSSQLTWDDSIFAINFKKYFNHCLPTLVMARLITNERKIPFTEWSKLASLQNVLRFAKTGSMPNVCYLGLIP